MLRLPLLRAKEHTMHRNCFDPEECRRKCNFENVGENVTLLVFKEKKEIVTFNIWNECKRFYYSNWSSTKMRASYFKSNLGGRCSEPEMTETVPVLWSLSVESVCDCFWCCF